MLIIEVKNGEIEKALKQLKRKFDKPSVIRRTEVNKAKFIQEKFGNNE